MAYETERRVAVEAVLTACRLCRNVQDSLSGNEALGKQDGSPVTVADFGAQALICERLQAAFPDDPIVGEEDTTLLQRDENRELKEMVIRQVKAVSPDRTSVQILAAIDRASAQGGPRGRFWTVDPIDGTKGFLRQDQYAVALALVENGIVVLGVLGCPNLPLRGLQSVGSLGCLLVAVQGEGAKIRRFDDSKEMGIAVTKTDDSSRAIISESFETDHSSHEEAAQVARQLGIAHAPLRIDSQCKYAVVARGDASIYLRLPKEEGYQEKIWDHAAGSLIVEEAGGRVTDVGGKTLDFSTGKKLLRNRGIIVSNGRLHTAVLEAVQAVRAGGVRREV
jgi:3'(2'), 5'-bisphosphate nucleotidase